MSRDLSLGKLNRIIMYCSIVIGLLMDVGWIVLNGVERGIASGS